MAECNTIQLAGDPWNSLTITAQGLSPVGIYLFKVNYRNIRTMCEICSKLTIKTPERRLSYRNQSFNL